MPETSALDGLRADLDYDKLVERASPALQLYIRTLEQENARLRQELAELRQSTAWQQRAAAAREQRGTETIPAQVKTVDHPQDVMVISITQQGQCKRTPLNDYSTQRRGGVGVLDIVTGRDDLVAHLLVARSSAHLLVLSDRGRAFRVVVDSLPLTEVRGRGTSLPERLMLADGESLAAVLALEDEDQSRSYLLIATAEGWVHKLRCNYTGPLMQPGTMLFDPRRSGGAPAATALSTGDADLLLALRSGTGIRFAEHLVRREGVAGIQIKPGDAIAGICGVRDDSAVLLVTADGKGTRRQMSDFRANKSPGGQGKVIVKTDALAGVAAVGEEDDVLCISAFSKIIRFAAAEVSLKTGAVQGNSVMDCRDNRLVAVAVVPPPP